MGCHSCKGSDKKTSFLGGIVLGAVVGAVAGILFAPTSGKDTRQKIKKMVDENGEFLSDAKEKTEEAVHKTMDAIKTGIDRLGKMVHDKRRGPGSDDDPDNSEAAA